MEPNERRWTTAEDRVVRRMVAAGKDEGEIARAVGRTPAAVHGRKEKIGARRWTRLSAADRSTVVAGIGAGLSNAECDRRIGREWGECAKLVRKKLGVSGLDRAAAHRAAAEYRRRTGVGYPCPARDRVMAILADGPLTVRAVHERYGSGKLHSLHETLARLRREGRAVGEGKNGPHGVRWFSVGWWLLENRGLLHTKAGDVWRRFREFDYDDLYSQLQVEVAKCARSFRPRGVKFSTYVLGPATLSLVTWCRIERGRGVHCPGNEARNLGYPVADHELVPAYRYERVTETPPAPPVDEGFWEKAVAGLGERERAVILSHFRDGKNYADVGRELGVSRERVRQIAFAALDRIGASKVMDEYA